MVCPIFFSVSLLSLYRKATDFCTICWLCIYLLLWKSLSSLSVSCRLFRAFLYKTTSSTDRGNFNFFLSYIYLFHFFYSFHFRSYSSTFTLSSVLNYNGEFVHFYHVLDFNGNALIFPNNTILTIHLFHIVFIMLTYFSFILCCFKIFIIKFYWTFFSTSNEMIISWFLF